MDSDCRPNLVAIFSYEALDSQGNINFDASLSSGTGITKYFWLFGDELGPVIQPTVTTDNSITHKYSSSGNYTVSLIVEDKSGNQSSPTERSLEVVIRPSPCEEPGRYLVGSSTTKDVFVADEAFVDPSAMVTGNIAVCGNSRIEAGAFVSATNASSKVKLNSNAIIKGGALIYVSGGEFEVKDNAEIQAQAQVKMSNQWKSHYVWFFQTFYWFKC